MTITTSALWRAVACDLACLPLSLRSHLTQSTQGHSSSDIDRLCKLLIEEPLSMLGDDVLREELPVIVIDALDECGGLRHDESGKGDLRSLMRTLKRWIQADHLKKFKVVITSRPEDLSSFDLAQHLRRTQPYPGQCATRKMLPTQMVNTFTCPSPHSIGSL